jgi:hypothetical protein
MRIVVGAAFSTPPFSPGTAWDRLHYVLGLDRLGHEVYLIEEVDPDWCVDARGGRCRYEDSVNRQVFRSVLEPCGLLRSACQLYDGGRAWTGIDPTHLREALSGADLLFNISGHVRTDLVLDSVRRRAYVDQDPVYTQLWHTAYGANLNLERHDVLFTVGANVGTPHSPVPSGDLAWHHCPPVVIPEIWPFRPDRTSMPFTTVASWGRFADLHHRGTSYGSKREQFRLLADLPRAAGQVMELALRDLSDDDEDVALLRAGGWTVSDSRRLATLSAYRGFIARSRAEIGVAKGAYVDGAAGWLGDRSCHYLASGRPVLTSWTGLERLVPSGRGLLTFHGLEDAAEAVAAINRDYVLHRGAARKLAEDVFSYRKVLPAMIATTVGEAA